jgi:PAS domain S-box-containing protein
MSSSGEAAAPDLLSADVDPKTYRPAASRTLTRGAWVITIVVAIAIVVPYIAVQLQRNEIIGEFERRLQILADGRGDVIATWLEGMTRPADRVVDSELFRLFATELDLSGGDISDLATREQAAPPEASAPSGMGVPLAAQLPFMQQVLTDFIKSADFLAGYVVGRNGIAYVTSAGADTITPEQQAISAEVFEAGVLRYGPARAATTGLVLDVYAPIFRAQSEIGADRPVGVLLLTAPIAATLGQILTPPPLSQPGERPRLVQFDAGAFVAIAPGEVPPLHPVTGLDELAGPESSIPFKQRPSIEGTQQVFSIGIAVSGPAWWIVQEIDAAALDEAMSGFIAAAITVSVLVVLAVVIAFGAFWWRLSNEHNAAMADQFRHLASRIGTQKRLLNSINDTIADYIGLKSLDGTYLYVNPAFARALGRDVDKLVGLDDSAIFGAGTAERLKISDQRALASSAAVTIDEEIYLGKKLHYFQISKVPYQGDDGRTSGIVSVTRDVTELVEKQRKKEKAVQQMATALVRAVELRDPYLAGHSRRVAGFATAVAQRLDTSAEDIATVEIAANLSQIGKLAIPREILNKPDRLSEAEIKEIQRHVDHAAAILREIDFELPVAETMYQMHERLDGKGYPAGLSGGHIRLTARILGACDVFCARVEPRAYRSGISAGAALEILEQNADRYDPEVVAALRETVTSIAGEKLIASVSVD